MARLYYMFAYNRGYDIEPAYSECCYLLADMYLQNNQFEAAADLFSQLSGYKDSDTRLLAAKFSIANRMMENAQYAEAAAAFEELGDFRTSTSMAAQAKRYQTFRENHTV